MPNVNMGANATYDATVYLLSASVLDRRALALLLREEMGLHVAISSDFVPTSIWDALRQSPDLIIVNCDTPSSQVLDAVQMIPRLEPDAKILVLSAAVDPLTVNGWSRCALKGYVVKDGDIPEVKTAVDQILAGGEYFSSGVRRAVNQEIEKNGVAKLSRREAELLPLIAQGLKLRDAAREMSVSYKTAESYRTSLLRKLGVKDRVELTRYAIREKIIEA